MFKELEHAECTDDSGLLTYPYHYRAHPLVIQAANFVRQHLNEHACGQAGRLVAVLVGRMPDGVLGLSLLVINLTVRIPILKKPSGNSYRARN